MPSCQVIEPLSPPHNPNTPKSKILSGDIDERETWWVERQKALEQAGYILRPRYRPGRKPSWVGTNKSYHCFEDGQKNGVSVDPIRTK